MKTLIETLPTPRPDVDPLDVLEKALLDAQLAAQRVEMCLSGPATWMHEYADMLNTQRNLVLQAQEEQRRLRDLVYRQMNEIRDLLAENNALASRVEYTTLI